MLCYEKRVTRGPPFFTLHISVRKHDTDTDNINASKTGSCGGLQRDHISYAL
jgi:hypothetical protein